MINCYAQYKSKSKIKKSMNIFLKTYVKKRKLCD